MKKENMKKEYWKRVIDYPHYDVSNWGNVRSWGNSREFVLDKPKILKFWVDKDGYNTVRLCKKGVYKYFHVQCLVLGSFISERPNKMYACHNDGDKSNNRLDNLRWDTAINNERDKIKHGFRIKPQNNFITRLRYAMKITQYEFGDVIKASQSTVSNWEIGDTVPYRKKHLEILNKIAKKYTGEQI